MKLLMQVFYQNITCISNRSVIFLYYNFYLRHSRQVLLSSNQ